MKLCVWSRSADVSLSYNLEFGIKSKLKMCITAHYLQHGNIYFNQKGWSVLCKTKDEHSLIPFSKHSLYSLRFELKSNYMCNSLFDCGYAQKRLKLSLLVRLVRFNEWKTLHINTRLAVL